MKYRETKHYRDLISSDLETTKAYQEWLELPMTRMVVQILTLEGQPQLASPIDGFVASQSLGHAAGWANCLNRIQLLDDRPSEEIPMTYENQQEKDEQQ